MKKISNGKLIGIILAVILVIALGVDSFLPQSLEKSLEFWEITPKDNIEYTSDKLYIHDKEFFVYSALNCKDDGKDVYTITVGEITGIKKNKYDIVNYREIEDAKLMDLTYSENSNISNFPEHEVKAHSEYLGSIYVGTVPASCSSVLVNGEKAEMVKQSFVLNGEKVDFYLYYCAIEDEYQVNLTIDDTDGKTYYVSPIEKDGLVYPNIEIKQN